LLRHCIGDSGGTSDFSSFLHALRTHGLVLAPDEVAAARKLPFVWVFGRSFWTVSVFGANVYVENIMGGLQRPEIQEMVTGA
jgi:phenylacetate-CoA ligase